MELKEIVYLYGDHPNTEELINELRNPQKSHIHLRGLSGSSRSVLSAHVSGSVPGIDLFILTSKDEAAYFYNDLNNLSGQQNTLFFPSSYKRSVQYKNTDSGNIILRTEVLSSLGKLTGREDELFAGICIVTYPEALVETVITRKGLQQNTLQLMKGSKSSIALVEESLVKFRYSLRDFVYEPGQYAIRGGIVDIFSFSDDLPYRINFSGDEIDSIRTFDVDTQLSVKHLDSIYVIPNIQDFTPEQRRVSFLEFIPPASRVWITDVDYVVQKIEELYGSTVFDAGTEDEYVAEKKDMLIRGEDFSQGLKDFTVVEMGNRFYYSPASEHSFNTALQPAFNKNFKLLGEYLESYTDKGYANYVLSENKNQIERLVSIFESIDAGIRFKPLFSTLHEGFIDHDLRICCLTDHQIFDRYHKYRLNRYFSNRAALSMRELSGLQPGDYVVHVDHGIGIFGGLEKIEINKKMQEAVRLVYKDNDILYVSIHSLHRISKYKGRDDSPPKIYKLGTGAWQKLKQSTKKRVKDIARELISLYARRKTQKGFAFSADTYLQEELEASFLFDDTPDQLTASRAVKSDMEDSTPMDRLVCGDVGFGKTEVAVRAAFKAVADSKQVAVLVPTTILALQHFNTFSERLRDFPCNVDYISRLRKTKEQKETLGKLEEGKTDILIGTHRILGKDIKFKDLGLLVIDEEHRFGVIAKEKLRRLKLNIDTLTLTATPIPRTLQFSLLGARDLSVVNTPPPNRQPIFTELHTFNEDIIREGIEYEISRNGQVFFLHNRVDNITEIEALINKLCPGVKTAIAHGQMEGRKLEHIMLGFIQGDYDVLVATTIIESGLDIPNANTIFINNAQNYGLSDLHQLRGRVGRSNKKAFCYLLAPPLTFVTPEARRRLKAIEENSDLGSGLNIALQDLDIRGAGNLLGIEQSGFIADIGFDTYNRILNEAIQELKEEGDKAQHGEVPPVQGRAKVPPVQGRAESEGTFISDCQIDTDLEILFPDDYISNIAERMNLYRQLDNIETETGLIEFEHQLEDRFGPVPEPTRELLVVVRLRWISVRLGFERVILKNNILICYFISNRSSPYYESHIFSSILNFVKRNPSRFIMKEDKDRLTLTIKNIKSISEAVNFLKTIACM
jgi:transcription-repair coupling factor (superfamily II helicase)